MSTLALALGFFALTCATFGCSASDETLKGAEGEYCNGEDSDCKDLLVCDDFICSDNASGSDQCRQICDRLDECGVEQPNCRSACRAEIAEWGDAQQDGFRDCFVDDKSCEALDESPDPPQLCYDELPLPDDRRARCERYVNAASACGASIDAVDELSRSCRRMARTRGDEDWADSEACESSFEQSCDDQLSCFQDTFDPDPELIESSVEPDPEPNGEDGEDGEEEDGEDEDDGSGGPELGGEVG